MKNIYESDIFDCLPGRSMHPGGLRLTDRAVRLAGLIPGRRCADLGCGNGATCAYLTGKYGFLMTGLDISEALIEAGRQKHPSLRLICLDCRRLPFEGGGLDAVLLECTLSVIGSAAAVLGECARVLKPGGRLILSDITLKIQAAGTEDGPFTLDRLAALLKSAGFSLDILEDHTPALRAYAADIISLGEDTAALLCGCAGPDSRLGDLGYHLIIATRK